MLGHLQSHREPNTRLVTHPDTKALTFQHTPKYTTPAASLREVSWLAILSTLEQNVLAPTVAMIVRSSQSAAFGLFQIPMGFQMVPARNVV